MFISISASRRPRIRNVQGMYLILVWEVIQCLDFSLGLKSFLCNRTFMPLVVAICLCVSSDFEAASENISHDEIITGDHSPGVKTGPVGIHIDFKTN